MFREDPVNRFSSSLGFLVACVPRRLSPKFVVTPALTLTSSRIVRPLLPTGSSRGSDD
jgi:hypothetical protein